MQQSALHLAERHGGQISFDLIYEELFAGIEDRALNAETRNTISRVLWSLEKRGLIQRSPDGKGFELPKDSSN